jgi:hypothetical protein
MLPGPAKILVCPFCGDEKEVMQLLSGNTFGAIQWSDTRCKYPMMPKVSDIQQCTRCGRYYFLNQAKQREGSTHSFELGELTFYQLKEAKNQFDSDTLREEQRGFVLNVELVMAYNDKFQRVTDETKSNSMPVPSADDVRVFQDAVQELLDEIGTSKQYTLFRAELLREIGRFSEAKAVLEAMDDADKYEHWVATQMLKHIEQSDKRPFRLN